MKPGEMASELLDLETLAMGLVATGMEDAALDVLRASVKDLLVLRGRLTNPRGLRLWCAPGCVICDERRAS